jgi:hypothetical protein
MSTDKEFEKQDRDVKKKRAAIKKAIKLFEEKIGGKEVKVSTGEYIRLLELLHEIDEDAPREIRVTWVDPEQTETEFSTET